VVSYGSPTAPVADAEKAIARLRRLAKMEGAGLVSGSVQRITEEPGMSSWSEISGHKVTAMRAEGRAYIAVTNSEGQYEFQPLPAGKYELTANSEQGWWAEDGPVVVTPRSCTAVDFELKTDGRVSGRVTLAGADLGASIWVEIVTDSTEQVEEHSTYSDEHGHYEFHGLTPGRYLVAIGIGPGEEEGKPPVYYPGVRDRSRALPIQVGPAENRQKIDIDLPATAAP